MGMSAHPDWEWVEVGHSDEPLPGDLTGLDEHIPVTDDDYSGHTDYLGDNLSDHPGYSGAVHEPGAAAGLLGAEPDYMHFDPTQSVHVIGTPGEDMQNWHEQTNPDTCAVVAQESVLESVTGQSFSENALRDEAMAHGWYSPGGGTPLDDIGNLLEAHGIPVERQDGASLQDLAHELGSGHKVIAAVNGEEIWAAAHPGGGSTPLEQYSGIPGQGADHAVEVIGIDTSDPAHPMVVLNDPGTPGGAGLEVPAEAFQQAWSTSGDFMVHTLDDGATDGGTAALPS